MYLLKVWLALIVPSLQLNPFLWSCSVFTTSPCRCQVVRSREKGRECERKLVPVTLPSRGVRDEEGTRPHYQTCRTDQLCGNSVLVGEGEEGTPCSLVCRSGEGWPPARETLACPPCFPARQEFCAAVLNPGHRLDQAFRGGAWVWFFLFKPPRKG